MLRIILVAGVLALAACTGPGPAPTEDITLTPAATPPASEPAPPPTVTESPMPTVTLSSVRPETTSSRTATLKATTDGPATITYLEDGAEVSEDISGPWEKAVALTDSSTRLTLIVVSNGEASSVGCEITTKGVHIRNRNTSSGSPATATCRATIS